MTKHQAQTVVERIAAVLDKLPPYAMVVDIRAGGFKEDQPEIVVAKGVVDRLSNVFQKEITENYNEMYHYTYRSIEIHHVKVYEIKSENMKYAVSS